MPSKRVDIKYVRTHPSVSFEAVAAHYGLELEPAGSDPAQKKTLCPFHDDKKPSLNVNLDKRVYNCFACKAGGNIVDFVIGMEEINGHDAARVGAIKLAEICGVETSPQGGSAGGKRKAMSPKERIAARESKEPEETPADDASEDTPEATASSEPAEATRDNTPAQFEPYTRELPLAAEHPYLAERGLKPETIETFGLGYCKAGFQKGRIAIRLHDALGNPLGYAGRWAEAEPPEGTPRYLLPKGFPKEQVLFNANRVAPVSDEIVLVESYWSVFRLYELGVDAVSSMGRSLSPHHVEILIGLGVERVTVLFDGDAAGREGTAAAVEALVKSFYVRTPDVPDGFKPHKADEALLHELLPR